ncbi:MAG: 1,4-dihydroxy-2-naphthoate octaprenyltransferase [Dehalococcoidia bacterium]
MPATLRIWLLAARPASLTAAVVPLLVGTALVADQAFRPGLFVLALLGSMAFQAGTNLVNDHFDHVLGVDSADSLGPSGVIQRGLLSPTAVLVGGVAAFAVGAALGIVIVAFVGWPILAVGVLSLLAGFAYTAPPFKLAYRGLGEITTFVFMGVAIVMGAAYVQTEAWAWDAFLVSLPIGLLVSAILQANNLRDIEDDRTHGKRTIASLIGRPAADYEHVALIVGAYVIAGVLVVTKVAPLTALIVFASAPVALRVLLTLADSKSARSLNRVLLGTVGMHLIFGLLWALGLALDAWTS